MGMTMRTAVPFRPQAALAGLKWRRYSPGVTCTVRLKVRCMVSTVPNPQARAMSAMPRPVGSTSLAVASPRPSEGAVARLDSPEPAGAGDVGDAPAGRPQQPPGAFDPDRFHVGG